MRRTSERSKLPWSYTATTRHTCHRTITRKTSLLSPPETSSTFSEILTPTVSSPPNSCRGKEGKSLCHFEEMWQKCGRRQNVLEGRMWQKPVASNLGILPAYLSSRRLYDNVGLFRLVPSNFIQSVELNEKKTQQMRRMSQQRLSVAPVIGAPSSNSTNTGQ